MRIRPIAFCLYDVVSEQVSPIVFCRAVPGSDSTGSGADFCGADWCVLAVPGSGDGWCWLVRACSCSLLLLFLLVALLVLRSCACACLSCWCHWRRIVCSGGDCSLNLNNWPGGGPNGAGSVWQGLGGPCGLCGMFFFVFSAFNGATRWRLWTLSPLFVSIFYSWFFFPAPILDFCIGDS